MAVMVLTVLQAGSFTRKPIVYEWTNVIKILSWFVYIWWCRSICVRKLFNWIMVFLHEPTTGFLKIYRTCVLYSQGLQEKFCKVDQDCFGAPWTGWDLSQYWGFELKIPPKKSKIKTKRVWLRLWGPSEIHGSLLCSPGPGPMYPLNPLLIGPV